MRLLSEVEQNLIAGGDLLDSGSCAEYDPMGNYTGSGDCPSEPMIDPQLHTVVVSERKWTQEQKDEFDNETAAIAGIIDSCALGSPACIVGLYALKP
ncbi:hypothetical protein [Undibacterium luofuense]|uniref:Uncharacterized protein n=1 Tax=Undibacterium luofuense TaxID=2828733 RepID=A0A941DQY8_9BURK|nr:hypothetical protein [Undibacterium luofuense]MBR7784219.1 hypothetical protein [Undibacterium luofuense]